MNQNRKNKKGKGPRRPKNRRRRRGNRLTPGGLYEKLGSDRVPRSLFGASPFPMSMDRNLTFQENILLQGANPYLVKDFRANSCYDPDAAIGGGTVVGFLLMSNIYQNYFVRKISWRYTLSSNEPSVPVNFGFVLRDKQPSTTYVSWAECQYALNEAPTTRMNTVGETSGMGIYRSPEYSVDLGTVIGKKLTYMSDVDYSAAVTTNPSQIVWLSFMLLGATSSTALTNGAILNLSITFHTHFWSLVNIEPTFVEQEPLAVGNFLEALYCDKDGSFSRVLREIPNQGGKMTLPTSLTSPVPK